MRIPIKGKDHLAKLCDSGQLKQCPICDRKFQPGDLSISQLREKGKCPYCNSDILFAEIGEQHEPFIDVKKYLLMETIVKLYSAIDQQIPDKDERDRYLKIELGVDPNIVDNCKTYVNDSNVSSILSDEARLYYADNLL